MKEKAMKNKWRLRAKLALSICLICAIAVAASQTYNAGILRLIDNLGVMRWLHDPVDGSLTGFDSAGLETISLDSATGDVTATDFIGGGAGLTNLTATNLVGDVPDGNLSANVALLNAAQTFSCDLSGVNNAPLFRRPSSNKTALRIQGNFSALHLDSYAGGGSFDIDVGSENAVSSVRVSRNVINDPAPAWNFYPGNNNADASITLDPANGDIGADGSIAVGGNVSASGLSNSFGRIILTNTIRHFNTTGGRMDFNLGSHAQIGTGEYRFGSEVDTGASALFTTWFKGDNTVTEAMQLNHKTGLLTLNGDFNSETITANAGVIVTGVTQTGGVVKGFQDFTAAAETLTTADYYFQLNPSTGNQTVTLPTGAAIGTEFRGCILNGHATNTVSFDAGTDNIHAPGFYAATPYTLPDSTAHRWIIITRISATVWSIDTGLSG